MNTLTLTAENHARLIQKIEGVTYVSEPELLGGDLGWSVVIHITTNDDGWHALRLLKSAGADVLLDRIEHDAVLKIGVLWSCSEAFNDALLEIFSVEEWLRRQVAGRR